MVAVFNDVGQSCAAKNYCPCSLLSVVSKFFEKLVSNKLVDHLEKTGKTQLVSIGRSKNTDVIDVLIDESSLEEISYFKMLGLPFFSKLD